MTMVLEGSACLSPVAAPASAPTSRAASRTKARMSLYPPARRSLEQVAATHERINHIVADVADEASVYLQVYEKIGACDIVIANAGMAASVPFTRMTLNEWNEMLAVKSDRRVPDLARRSAPHERLGRLISVASTAASRAIPIVAHYTLPNMGASA